MWKAAAEVGLQFAAACALLMQESRGGHNIFAEHDTGMPFNGAGDVTEEKYLEYCAQRDSFDPPHCTGVGPTQLTSKTWQDKADALGGCWNPASNLVIGFSIIATQRAKGRSWHDCWLAYSGGKETYAMEMDTKHAWWKAVLNPKEPT